MNSAFLAIIGLIALVLAYKFYGGFLARKIYQTENDKFNGLTPANQFNDGIDYVPTKKEILFGHHFSSIAGAAPIVGPAVAAIWGWGPAILWVILGVIFMGACHDFGTLVVSMKHKGNSLAYVAENLMNKRVKKLFMTIIFFLVWMVIAVFTLVIANLFIQFPGSVIPVNFEIIIALFIGFFINKKGKNILLPSIFAQVILFILIIVGTYYPISLNQYVGSSDLLVWIIFLMIYCFFASVLPVWMLLQPRDFINSHQLIIGLLLMVVGLIITHPPVVAPFFNPHPNGAPPWFPFLFITIACGAISGFHGLVSGGTTSKQVKNWKDTKFIGYGGMLGEGLLALLATLAVTAGFNSEIEWHNHFSDWNKADGLTNKINAFVIGASKFLSGVGIPNEISQTVLAVLIISFAATSLDTACRIQRYIIAEMTEGLKNKAINNRYTSSGLAVLSAFLLMMVSGKGKGGLLLWPLFGATNQMLAGLGLLVILVYLAKNKRPLWPLVIPCIFLLLMTGYALFLNINIYISKSNWYLAILGIVLFLAQLWIFSEALNIFRKERGPI